VSAGAIVDVARSSTTIDPAVRDATPPAQVWPAPDPAGGLPRYHAGSGDPSPPSGPGVVLAAERVVHVRDGATCPLHGAVRAVPRDTHRAKHGAVVPVTLVVTGTESPGPFVVPLRVPSFDTGAAAGAEVTAHFAVDLFRLAPIAAAPQTYFVHAFTADGHAAAKTIAVVAA
jgi:hypothetical protein